MTFSTFVGCQGLWLDDLYVQERFRSRGVGEALLSRLASVAKERGYARIEWTAAASNARGLTFYRRLGATVRDTTRCVRLDEAAILYLAEPK